MGVYINPPSEFKEEWLQKNAEKIDGREFMSFNFEEKEKEGKRAVVLVDNGMFTAAAVMFSENELKYWREEKSPRLRTFFFAPIEKLTGVAK